LCYIQQTSLEQSTLIYLFVTETGIKALQKMDIE